MRGDVACGDVAGEAVTVPLAYAGSRLLLNVDCGGAGELRVELQASDDVCHIRKVPY